MNIHYIYSNPKYLCLQNESADYSRFHVMARNYYQHFTRTTNNRAEILQELLNYSQTPEVINRFKYQLEEQSSAIKKDGNDQIVALHGSIMEAFSTKMGKRWKDEDKEKVFKRLAYPGIRDRFLSWF